MTISSREQRSARRTRAERVERDEMIRRLRAEGHSIHAIAERANCGTSTAYEILRPDRRAAYNERRRRHWRELAGKA